MRVEIRRIAPLLVGVGIAFAAAPIATAAPSHPASGATTAPASGPAAPQSCTGLGGTQSECQSPGNVQINDSPPQVDYFPYGGGAT